MPRIDAPTVAEHHARRRAALVAAGADLLASGGVEAVTLGAVGSATGLARSSVYQYFDSAPALLAAVVEEVFPRSTAKLRAAVERAATPEAKATPGLFEAFASAYPLGRVGTSGDIAAACAWLASDECFMTGQNLQVNGGLTLRRNPNRDEIHASVMKAMGAS